MSNNNFIIDPSDTTVTSIKSKIEDYLKTLGDYSTWKDFYASGTGQILIKILAGVITVLNYRVIISRREAYLKYAQNRTSVTAMCENLGYKVFRGKNARFLVTITSESTKALPKYSIIGSYGDFDLITLEDSMLNSGVPTQVSCTIGVIKEDSVTAESDLLATFRFISESVSEDVRLFINETEVEYETRILALGDNKFVVTSNGFDSVDVLTLNQGSVKYDTGDLINIKYIERADPEIQMSDFSFEENVTAIELTSAYQERETLPSMQLKAPLFHESQLTVKARDDFYKVALQQNPELIDAKSRDISPAVVSVTYLKSDLFPYLLSELTSFLSNINAGSVRGKGIPPCRAEHPLRQNVKLNVLCYLSSSTTEDINSVVASVFSKYEKLFESKIDLLQIESDIEKKSYVKAARVSLKTVQRLDETFYSLMDFIEDQNFIYEYFGEYKITGQNEPNWPTVEGQTIVDGDIIWECTLDYRNGLKTWSGETQFTVGETIKPTNTVSHLRYLCIGHVTLSGQNEPTWPTSGTVADSELVWEAREVQGTPNQWESNKSYLIGDSVLPSTPNEKMYQVVGVRSKSGINFSPSSIVGETFIDGGIIWKTRSKNDMVISSKWNGYFLVTPSIELG